MTVSDRFRLTSQLAVLREVAADYQGKTIDNIIQQMEAIGALLRYKKLGDKSSFPRAFNLIKDAKMELSKPDWISVEDELPPYGEVVLVVCEIYPNVIWSTKRMDRFENGRTLDEPLFNTKEHLPIITHWRKIDKLEV